MSAALSRALRWLGGEADPSEVMPLRLAGALGLTACGDRFVHRGSLWVWDHRVSAYRRV